MEHLTCCQRRELYGLLKQYYHVKECTGEFLFDYSGSDFEQGFLTHLHLLSSQNIFSFWTNACAKEFAFSRGNHILYGGSIKSLREGIIGNEQVDPLKHFMQLEEALKKEFES